MSDVRRGGPVSEEVSLGFGGLLSHEVSLVPLRQLHKSFLEGRPVDSTTSEIIDRGAEELEHLFHQPAF